MSSSSLYEFTDFRSFLNAHAEEKRQSSSKWTLGVWSRQLRLKATTSLTMILNGQRNPGPKITENLVRYFRFNRNEKKYFQDLILLQKVKNDDRIKTMVLEELQSLNPNLNITFLDHAKFQAISKWYYYCIRQLARLDRFNEDPYWIQERLLYPVGIEEIKRALNTLEEIGLLCRAPDGRLIAAETGFRTQNDTDLEAIRRFHEEIIQIAKTSVRDFHFSKRELQALTLAFDLEHLDEAKDFIRSFIRSFDQKFCGRNTDSVFQLSLQFFPIALKDKTFLKKRKKEIH